MSNPNAAPDTVLLLATRDQLPGALHLVGGLTVVERAIKQLGRLLDVKVVVAADGAVPLPTALPANVAVRHLAAGDLSARLAPLRAELGEPPVLRANVVRVSPRRFEDGYEVVDEPSRRRAEDAVFNDLLRGDLGFVARNINKKLSFRFTRYVLCRLPTTPNQVTLAAGLLGLLGCLLIASGQRLAVVAGFTLAQVQSILDGCDGELARVRFQQTPLGEWLDTVVDDFLNIALLAAMGVGLWRHGGTTTHLAWALAGSAMLLIYNVIAYRELLEKGEGGDVLKIRWWWARGQDFKSLLATGQEGGSRLNLLVALGKRDFFVLAWLILALLDQRGLILVYGVVIAAIYFVVAVVQLLHRPRPGPASG